MSGIHTHDGEEVLLKVTDSVLKLLEVLPPDQEILDGLLARPKLHYMRSLLFLHMEQYENAMQELDAGIALDSTNVTLLLKRAWTMSSHDFVNDRALTKEWKHVADVCHPDSLVLPTVYARRAIHVLSCPMLGTCQQGCEYLEKMKAAHARYLELNGDKRPDMRRILRQCQWTGRRSLLTSFSYKRTAVWRWTFDGYAGSRIEARYYWLQFVWQIAVCWRRRTFQVLALQGCLLLLQGMPNEGE